MHKQSFKSSLMVHRGYSDKKSEENIRINNGRKIPMSPCIPLISSPKTPLPCDDDTC